MRERSMYYDVCAVQVNYPNKGGYCWSLPMIEIKNRGADLIGTNYWDTPNARAGYVFASWNAGALRLLIPDALLDQVPEMRTGRAALVTHGKLDGRDAIEVMFDDGTESPYALHIVVEQCDRVLPKSDAGKRVVVTAWSRAGKLAEWPGVYRIARTLPYMRP
jgi:hypothetical protein